MCCYSNSPVPAIGSDRVLQGGSWENGDDFLRSAYRNGYFPSYQFYDFGFRCARSP